MDNQVVKMLGIDQGKRFVFCSGPQIDLWTELRAEKWSKNTFFWGLDPGLDPKFRREKWRVELAREYLRTGAELRETTMGSFVPGIIYKKWPKKLKKIKMVKNGQPSSQNVRNRLGNNICPHFRASNRPLDGVKGQKVVKNTFLGVWARF